MIIPFYFLVNYIIFFIYTVFIAQKMHVGSDEILEYSLDVTIAFIFIFVTCFILHIIYIKALQEAENEIKHNIELNKQLEKKAELEIEHTNKIAEQNELLADKAAVTTGVLHNIGNLLNNVSLTSSIIRDYVKKSKMEGILKLSNLINENKLNIPDFINSQKGKSFFQYIEVLAENYKVEKNELDAQLDKLSEYIDHMDEVIRLQQSLSSTNLTHECTTVDSIIKEVLVMQQDNLVQENIEVIYNVPLLPDVYLDRHRILQILNNLVNNARNALKESNRQKKILKIDVRYLFSDRIAIDIEDNGCGIAEENLARIFKYGFTTRRNGHGFGLYYSENTALNMGGKLSVKANNSGAGVTFTFELPLKNCNKSRD